MVKTKQRRRRRRTRKGGYFYQYNKNPLLFTESSNQVGGWAGDPRSTFFPSLFTDIARNTQYSSMSSTASFLGKPPPINPIVTSQPINKYFW